MKKKKLIQSKRKGSAIVLAVFVVVILITTGMGLLSLGLHSRIFAIRTTSDIAARTAADAGLTKAIFQMNEQLKVKPWDDSTLPTTTDETLANFDATFSYTVSGDLGSGYAIDSVGKSGQATAQNQVNGTLKLKGLFEYAIFTQDGLELKNGSVVDWYNNDADDSPLKIGTNSTSTGAIGLKNMVTINGDVLVGVDGDPDDVINNTGATITGNEYAQTEETELPAITVPASLASLPSGGTITSSTTISSDAKYDGINLLGGGSKILTIDGDVSIYITGDITLGNSSELQIVNNGSSSLTLYLAGDIESKNGSALNNLTQDAKKLTIYGLATSDEMVFKVGGVFYGAIYAPTADVVFHNAVEIYGAVVANSFEQKNSAPFHYDASLRDVSVNDEGVQFTLNRWSEQ